MDFPNLVSDAGSSRWVRTAVWAFMVLAIGYLALTLIRQPLEVSDFRYIWTAGDVWGRQGNPYGPAYPLTGARQFPTGFQVLSWVYPFHWYLPARFAAAFDPPLAFALWLVLNTALLALAGWLAWRAASAIGARWPLTVSILVVGYVCSSTPLTFLLRHGHPAGLAVFGIALMAYGVAMGRPYLTAIGTALAMLKPHLGVPILVALLFMPRGFYAAAFGAALTLLASVPAFVAAGFWPQVEGLLAQSAGGYQYVTYNTAGAMSGSPHVVFLVTGHAVSLTRSLLLAALLVAAAMTAARRVNHPRRTALFIALSCSITAAIVSLHGYDLTILLIPLPLLPLLSRRELTIAGAGYALLWRPENLAVLLGDFWYTPTLQSLAAGLIMLAWLLTARHWVAATRSAIPA